MMSKFVNVTSVVYQLPVGKGRQFMGSLNPILDAVLGGWEINTINTASTGLPVNVYYTPTTAASCQRYRRRISRPAVPAPQRLGKRRQPKHAAEPADLFRRLYIRDALGDNPFGNLGRNAFRAPGMEQWDLGLNKNFRITEA